MQNLGPVTVWVPRSKAGADRLHDLYPTARRGCDGSVTVPSRDNCGVQNSFRAWDLTLEDVT
jgi:hypothetical protein